MLLDIRARGTDGGGVRRAAALRRRHDRLQHALAHQMPRHLGLGLFEIPVDQPADFGTADRILGEQSLVALQRATCLVDIFGDDGRADDRLVALGEQHGDVSGRVERQELLATVPGLFLDQGKFLAILPEGEADEAAAGEKRMVKQREHGAPNLTGPMVISRPPV